jgi:hypothetical protein
MFVDNGMYRASVDMYQDRQQAQVAACRDFYREVNVDRISVLDYDEVEEPLEKTRIYGPFGLEVLEWVRMNPLVKLMVDADGRECVEY